MADMPRDMVTEGHGRGSSDHSKGGQMGMSAARLRRLMSNCLAQPRGEIGSGDALERREGFTAHECLCGAGAAAGAAVHAEGPL
ncbi:hypothetical protein GCM10009817_18160 [Terrabacter lapilli]|uniref:Uncharacterized protein n=1 Tax=Terrabacter lapilli TaxID=436231 RepID=A0ABP5DF65_9MICO